MNGLNGGNKNCQDTFPETPKEIKNAVDNPAREVQDDFLGYSEEELKARGRGIQVKKQQDAYKRDRDEEDTIAKLRKNLIIYSAYGASIIFCIAIIALIVSWIFPSLFPKESKATIELFVTFGFGMISNKVLDRIFPKTAI